MRKLVSPSIFVLGLIVLTGCSVESPRVLSSQEIVEQPQATPSPTFTTKPRPVPTAKPSIPPKETAPPKPEPTIIPTPTPPTAPVTPPVIENEIIKEIMYTTQNLNVRSGPGTKYQIIDQLNTGDEVPLDAKFGNWKRIKDSNLWVNSSYLTEVKPSKEIPTDKLEDEARTILSNYGCSTANVIVDDARLGETAMGKADWGSNTVLLRSTAPVERINYILAHECMHLRQYDAYGADVDKLASDMNAVYTGRGFDGLEQNADCMVQKLGVKEYNYTVKCSGKRGSAALSILDGKTLI